MSMMGSAPAGGGGELSFVDVLNLMKDEPAYQTKLRELARRMEEAAALHKQAMEIAGKAAEDQKFTAAMAAKAEQQLLEAKHLKEAAEKQAAATAAQAQSLAQQNIDWQKQVAEQKEKDSQSLVSTFAAREKEILAKEKKLMADMKEFEAIQADRHDRANEFDAYRQGKEDEFTRARSELARGQADLQGARAEVERMQAELKAKLDKIRAISVG